MLKAEEQSVVIYEEVDMKSMGGEQSEAAVFSCAMSFNIYTKKVGSMDEENAP